MPECLHDVVQAMRASVLGTFVLGAARRGTTRQETADRGRGGRERTGAVAIPVSLMRRAIRRHATGCGDQGQATQRSRTCSASHWLAQDKLPARGRGNDESESHTAQRTHGDVHDRSDRVAFACGAVVRARFGLTREWRGRFFSASDLDRFKS